MSEREASRGFWDRCIGTTARDRRNGMRVMGAILLWAVVYTASSQLLKRDALPDGWIPWVVATLPSVVGIYLVVAYIRFLREADELLRLVHYEALALGFTCGWLVISGYRVFERLGAPTADIADATLALALFYSIGIVRGSWRFR